MALSIKAQPIPITLGEDGIARLADTRVRLEAVVAAYHEGATAEEISLRYTTVDLADVYFVIGYYLKNRYEVDKYLREREAQDRAVREEARAAYLAGGRLPGHPSEPGIRRLRFDRITVDPARQSGKPCIRNLDLRAADILNYLSGGMTVEDVLADWPALEPEDVSQALGYAAWALDQEAPPLPTAG
jgi:uncharacterized protein (DUF433 family)